jgi:(p)ppGpp synthase/HD superfamily hydrolase
LAIAALLHDGIEDQGGKARLEDVRNRFGDRVARGVEVARIAYPTRQKARARQLVMIHPVSRENAWYFSQSCRQFSRAMTVAVANELHEIVEVLENGSDRRCNKKLPTETQMRTLGAPNWVRAHRVALLLPGSPKLSPACFGRSWTF